MAAETAKAFTGVPFSNRRDAATIKSDNIPMPKTIFCNLIITYNVLAKCCIASSGLVNIGAFFSASDN